MAISLTDSLGSGTDGSSFTFSGANVGAAAADRITLVAVQYYGTAVPTGVTVGGAAATMLVASYAGADAHPCSIWAVANPTGTTATIVVSLAASTSWLTCRVARLTGCNPTPVDTAAANDTGFPNTGTVTLGLSIDAKASGAIFAAGGGSVVNTPSTAAFTGLSTGAALTLGGEAAYSRAGYLQPSSDETPRAVSLAIGGGGANNYTLGAAAVSFAPAISEVTGTSAVTLAALTASGSGTVRVSGASSAALASLTAAGAGTPSVPGSAAGALAALTAAGSGSVDVTGQAAYGLAAITGSSAGSVSVSGTAAATLAALTGAGSGAAVPVTVGNAGVTLAPMTASASGSVAVTGAVAGQLAAMTATGAAATPVTGAGAATLSGLSAAATGDVLGDVTGAAAATLGVLTGSATATVPVTGSASVTLSPLIGGGSPTRPRRPTFGSGARPISVSTGRRGHGVTVSRPPALSTSRRRN